MCRLAIPMVIAPVFLVGCAARPNKPLATTGTLAELRNVRPDVQEVKVEQGLDQAMQQYRRFLKETPETSMTPEAMRRLADLQLEKQFGIRTGSAKPREMAAPKPAMVLAGSRAGSPNPAAAAASAGLPESDQDFERRTTAEAEILAGSNAGASPTDAVPAGADPGGPLEAIALYNRLLTEYPNYKNSDQVLYQMARAYDELGRTEEAIETMERLIRANPHSSHLDEEQFRRGEYFFTRRRFRDAESAYSGIVKLGTASEFYELALYKLGWTFYKQDFYEEALRKYIALLDYKVSVGYDFDQKHDEDSDRRVAVQHARRGYLHPGRVPQAGARVEARVRFQIRPEGRILATLQTGRVAGSTGLPEDEPERPRDALSRPVSERKRNGREAHELSRGKPVVRRLPRVLPEGS